MTKYIKKAGFTLVEMAIVLVIIAIIIAAILQGREIFTNTKMNAIVTKYKEYDTAYHQFKEKYSFAPGDYPEGPNQWPSVAGAGDGNGIIDGLSDPNWPESYVAWQELTLAGFMDGAYTGWSSVDDGLIDIGADIPGGPFPGTGYFMSKYIYGNISYGNVDAISLGGVVSTSNVYGGYLTPSQAYFIDSKLDDNNPGSGRLVTWAGTSPTDGSTFPIETCVTGSGDTDFTNDAYALDQTEPNCYTVFWLEEPYLNK